ncbi:hypothetical protein C0J52_00677 [Blattella germanica]|nr:hypothetical protein C0J52_00677 [Blattella germanica]
MASRSINFFDIVATDIDTFVEACNQFEEITLIKLGALRSKELSHSLPAVPSSLFWKAHHSTRSIRFLSEAFVL